VLIRIEWTIVWQTRTHSGDCLLETTEQRATLFKADDPDEVGGSALENCPWNSNHNKEEQQSCTIKSVEHAHTKSRLEITSVGVSEDITEDGDTIDGGL
jgi:hypothetical protein